MSVVHNIWLEELERIKRIIASDEQRLASYPKGSIQLKKINGRSYYYLSWWENGKVKSRYLGNDPSALKQLQIEICARKAREDALRKARIDMKLLEKAVKMKVMK